MSKSPEDIAQGLADHVGQCPICGNNAGAIAAALRAYGNYKLELAAAYIEEKDGYWQDGIRELKDVV